MIALVTDSMRRKDENGYLHVAQSALTKEQVAPYRGEEIPGWDELGLDRDRMYHVYRPAEELEKAVDLFNGLPILLRHKKDSAWDPQKALRVGVTGTSAVFDAPYLKNALVFHDAEAIDLIESNQQKELSSGYRYTPLVKSGVFQGQPYDLVMTDIRGNHVALVREGRAGEDVVVADSALRQFRRIAELDTGAERTCPKGEPQNVASQQFNGGFMKISVVAKKIAAALRGSPVLAQDGDVPNVEAVVEKAVAQAVTELAEGEKEPVIELDGEGEGTDPPAADPAAKDEDPAAKLAALLGPLLEGKTEVAGKPVAEWLAEVAAAMAPQAADEDSEAGEKKDMAKDAAPHKPGVKNNPARKEKELVMDAAALTQKVERDLAARYRAKEEAVQAVQPMVGLVSAMAFDSAEDIYAYALNKQGIKSADYPRTAWKGIFDGLAQVRRQRAAVPAMAQDAKNSPLGDVDFSRFNVSD